MAQEYHVTSVGITPAQDRSNRMKFYFIAMSIRFACVASLFFVRGWWLIIPALGAVFLPYFAVVIANAVDNASAGQPDAPTPLELHGTVSSGTEASGSQGEAPLIVIDAPAERRSTATDARATSDPDPSASEREHHE